MQTLRMKFVCQLVRAQLNCSCLHFPPSSDGIARIPKRAPRAFSLHEGSVFSTRTADELLFYAAEVLREREDAFGVAAAAYYVDGGVCGSSRDSGGVLMVDVCWLIN